MKELFYRFLALLTHPPWVRRRAIEQYWMAGQILSSNIKRYFSGDRIDISYILTKWQIAEEDYSSLGYETIPLEEFLRLDGGRPGNLGKFRKLNSPEILYSRWFIENWTKKDDRPSRASGVWWKFAKRANR